MRCGMRPKIVRVSKVLQSHVLCSDAADVISDCDGVPGQYRAIILCARSVLGVHTVILDSGKVSYNSSCADFDIQYVRQQMLV